MPLIVIRFDVHCALTPAGSPVEIPIPVAPEVTWVMLDMVVPTHNVGELDDALTVLLFTTLMIPLAYKVSQPPVRGMA